MDLEKRGWEYASFGVLYTMLKDERTTWRTSTVLLLVEFSQIYFNVMIGGISWDFTWAERAMTNPTRLGFFNTQTMLLNRGYAFYQALFWTFIAGVMGSFIVSIWVATNFKNNQFPYVMPIKVMRAVVSTFFDIFYVDSLSIMLIPFACSGGMSKVFTTTSCYGAIGSLQIAAAVLASICMSLLTYGMNITKCNPDFMALNHLHMTQSSFTTLLFVYKFIITVLNIIFDTALLPTGIILTLLAIYTLYEIVSQMPYVAAPFNCLQGGLQSLLVWTGIVVAYVAKYPDNSPTASKIYAGGVIPSFVIGWFIVYMQQRYLDSILAKYIKDQSYTHRFSSDLQVEILSRCCRRMHSSTPDGALVDIAERILDDGYKQFKKSVFMRLTYSNFLLQMRSNQQKANEVIDGINDLLPNYAQRFQIFIRERKQKQMLNQRNNKNAADIVSYVEFQMYYNTLTKTNRDVMNTISELWNMLLQRTAAVTVGYADIVRCLAKYAHATQQTDKMYELMIQRYPDNTKVLRAYGRYLEDIKNKASDASHYLHEADRVEEEHVAKRKQTIMGYLRMISTDAIEDVGLIIFDINNRIKMTNTNVNSILGYDLGELEGEMVSEVFPSPYKFNVTEYLNLNRPEMMKKPYKLLVKTKDGRIVPVMIRVNRVEEDYDVIYICVIYTMGEGVELGEGGIAKRPSMWVSPETHNVIMFNREFAKIFGYTQMDLPLTQATVWSQELYTAIQDGYKSLNAMAAAGPTDDEPSIKLSMMIKHRYDDSIITKATCRMSLIGNGANIKIIVFEVLTLDSADIVGPACNCSNSIHPPIIVFDTDDNVVYLNEEFKRAVPAAKHAHNAHTVFAQPYSEYHWTLTTGPDAPENKRRIFYLNKQIKAELSWHDIGSGASTLRTYKICRICDEAAEEQAADAAIDFEQEINDTDNGKDALYRPASAKNPYKMRKYFMNVTLNGVIENTNCPRWKGKYLYDVIDVADAHVRDTVLHFSIYHPYGAVDMTAVMIPFVKNVNIMADKFAYWKAACELPSDDNSDIDNCEDTKLTPVRYSLVITDPTKQVTGQLANDSELRFHVEIIPSKHMEGIIITDSEGVIKDVTPDIYKLLCVRNIIGTPITYFVQEKELISAIDNPGIRITYGGYIRLVSYIYYDNGQYYIMVTEDETENPDFLFKKYEQIIVNEVEKKGNVRVRKLSTKHSLRFGNNEYSQLRNREIEGKHALEDLDSLQLTTTYGRATRRKRLQRIFDASAFKRFIRRAQLIVAGITFAAIGASVAFTVPITLMNSGIKTSINNHLQPYLNMLTNASTIELANNALTGVYTGTHPVMYEPYYMGFYQRTEHSFREYNNQLFIFDNIDNTYTDDINSIYKQPITIYYYYGNTSVYQRDVTVYDSTEKLARDVRRISATNNLADTMNWDVYIVDHSQLISTYTDLSSQIINSINTKINSYRMVITISTVIHAIILIPIVTLAMLYASIYTNIGMSKVLQSLLVIPWYIRALMAIRHCDINVESLHFTEEDKTALVALRKEQVQHHENHSKRIPIRKALHVYKKYIIVNATIFAALFAIVTTLCILAIRYSQQVMTVMSSLSNINDLQNSYSDLMIAINDLVIGTYSKNNSDLLNAITSYTSALQSTMSYSYLSSTLTTTMVTGLTTVTDYANGLAANYQNVTFTTPDFDVLWFQLSNMEIFTDIYTIEQVAIANANTAIQTALLCNIFNTAILACVFAVSLGILIMHTRNITTDIHVLNEILSTLPKAYPIEADMKASAYAPPQESKNVNKLQALTLRRWIVRKIIGKIPLSKIVPEE